MDGQMHYIELCKNPIRFDAVSQLTTVFFDDSNKQIFAVRSGGATGVVARGPTDQAVISFCMNDRGTIRFIKFSPDNQILAVQRRENAVEFICFQNDQPLLQDIITHQLKALIYGFVWVHTHECALITNTGIEIITIVSEKHQVRSVKTLNMSIKWFAWCSEANIALLCSATEHNLLTPVIIRQKTITKLPKLELGNNEREVHENKVTLAQVYGVMAVLILQASNTGFIEVEVFLLNGAGLAPRKCHVLRLGHIGLFAINTVDNLIVVHHQASRTSMLFDIALNGEVINDVTYHIPITPGRSIRPFALKLPSISPNGETLQCDLYSTNWVLFQPNIVIDAMLGCMWYLNLCIEPLCTLISDRIKLTEFLLQRKQGKEMLLQIIKQLILDESSDNGNLLPVLEVIFNKINNVYASWVQSELQAQTAQPSNIKSTTNKKITHNSKVIIEQTDMLSHVFKQVTNTQITSNVLLLYLQSLTRHNICAQEELSKLIIVQLIKLRDFNTLRHLVSYSLLLESKSVACFLLSHSNIDSAVSQVALDMLYKIKAHEIIIEVLLGEGKVIDALRLAQSMSNENTISARKYLEAALHTNNNLIFHSVLKYFQMRNLRLRGTTEFLKTEQCNEYVQYYKQIYKQNSTIL